MEPATIRPPPGLTERAGTWDDLDAVTALVATASRARLGRVTVRRDDLRVRWLGLEQLEVVRLLVDTTDPARLVAYSSEDLVVDPHTGEVELDLDGQVDPAHTGRGAASYLLRRAVDRARSAAADAGGEPALLHTAVVDGDAAARRFFTRRGFHPVRHLLELRLDLHAPPPAVSWPDGVVVRQLELPTDERTAWQVHRSAVADVPTHLPLTAADFRASRLTGPGAIDPALSLLVEADGEVVALALCRAGAPGAPHDGWIRDLAVVPGWRRHGIGMALLRTALHRIRAHGLTGAALEVDDVTLDGAVALYRRAGMRIVHRTDVLARPVPPGS